MVLSSLVDSNTGQYKIKFPFPWCLYWHGDRNIEFCGWIFNENKRLMRSGSRLSIFCSECQTKWIYRTQFNSIFDFWLAIKPVALLVCDLQQKWKYGYDDAASLPFGPTATAASENDQDCAAASPLWLDATVTIESTETSVRMRWTIACKNNVCTRLIASYTLQLAENLTVGQGSELLQRGASKALHRR